MKLIYLDPTPIGFEVVVHKPKIGTNYRAHQISDDSYELYFEVGVYQNLPAGRQLNYLWSMFLNELSSCRLAR